MPTRNNNRQQTVGWTPAVFQGEEWSPTPFDYSVMERSLARQEERQNKATQQISAVKVALGQAREKLHRDDATLQWFDEKANQIEQNLQDYANVGDFAGAINRAIQEAGDLATDAELAGHIRNNSEYQQQMKELDDMVNKNIISNATANWIRKENPYSINFKRDGDGNVIGTEEWKFKEKPVADLDINKFIEEAFKSINPDQISGSVASNVYDSQGNLVRRNPNINQSIPNNTSYIGAISQQHSSTTRQVRAKEILDQVMERLYALPDWEQKLRQLYNGAFQSYKDNKEKFDNMSEDDPNYQIYSDLINRQEELFYKNGQVNKQDVETFKNYFTRVLFDSPQAKAYGYKISDVSDSLQGSSPKGPNNENGSGVDKGIVTGIASWAGRNVTL